MSEHNPFSLAGKSILVTGASSGIGQATAIACSRLGARVVVTGRDLGRLQATFERLEGTEHRQVPADLTSDDGLKQLVAACPELGGVVLSAGANQILPFTRCSKSAFQELFGVNFTAPIELLRLLLKERVLADGGSVVLVSSVASLPGGAAAGNTMYGASKAALDAAMRHLAREYAKRKIRFNTVNPGVVNTSLVQRLHEKFSSEQLAADLARYPLGRYGEPSDIANGIVYLLSDAAAWVTGQHLVIDGGLTM